MRLLITHQLELGLLLAPLLLFPYRFPVWAFCAAMLLMALPWLGRTIRPPDGDSSLALSTLVLLFLLTHLSAMYLSRNMTISGERFAQNLLGMALLTGIASRPLSRQNLIKLVSAFFLLASSAVLLVPTVASVLSDYKYFPTPAFLMRGGLLKESIHPNIWAGLIILLLPVGLGLLLTRLQDYIPSPRINRSFTIAYSLALVALAILSQSRAGWLALTVALIIFAASYKDWRHRAVLLGIVIAILILCMVGYGHEILQLFMPSVPTRSDTVELRKEAWNSAMLMIREFPFTGIGLGSYLEFRTSVYPIVPSAFGAPLSHAHQLFLQIGVDLGIPGLAAYAALMGFVMSVGIRSLQKGRNRALMLGLLCSAVTVWVHGLMDAPMWGSKVAPAVWVVVGFVLALARLEVKEKYVTPTPPDNLHWRNPYLILGWLLISLTAILFIGVYFVAGFILAILGGGLIGFRASFCWPGEDIPQKQLD